MGGSQLIAAPHIPQKIWRHFGEATHPRCAKSAAPSAPAHHSGFANGGSRPGKMRPGHHLGCVIRHSRIPNGECLVSRDPVRGYALPIRRVVSVEFHVAQTTTTVRRKPRNPNCSRCSQPRDTGHVWCRACKAAWARTHRPKHSELPPAERIAANARSYANVYQRRGKLLRLEQCEHCGGPNPEKHWSDYAQPLVVLWLCRPCRRRHQIAA